MIILALDLGETVGAASGRSESVPAVETIRMGGEIGAWALRLEGFLRGCFREFRPDVVAYEEPFPPVSDKWRARGQARLKESLTTQFGQKVLIEKVAFAEHGVRTLPLPVNQARRLALGNGYPSEAEIMEGVHRLGVNAGNPHEADAAVIWHAARAWRAAE